MFWKKTSGTENKLAIVSKNQELIWGYIQHLPWYLGCVGLAVASYLCNTASHLISLWQREIPPLHLQNDKKFVGEKKKKKKGMLFLPNFATVDLTSSQTVEQTVVAQRGFWLLIPGEFWSPVTALTSPALSRVCARWPQEVPTSLQGSVLLWHELLNKSFSTFPSTFLIFTSWKPFATEEAKAAVIRRRSSSLQGMGLPSDIGTNFQK